VPISEPSSPRGGEDSKPACKSETAHASNPPYIQLLVPRGYAVQVIQKKKDATVYDVRVPTSKEKLAERRREWDVSYAAKVQQYLEEGISVQ